MCVALKFPEDEITPTIQISPSDPEENVQETCLQYSQIFASIW